MRATSAGLLFVLGLSLVCGCGSTVQNANTARKSSHRSEPTTSTSTSTPPTSEPSTLLTTTTAPTLPATYRLGETAQLSIPDPYPSGGAVDLDLTINGVDDPSNLDVSVPSDDATAPKQPPPPGQRNVALNVTVENVGQFPLVAFPSIGNGVLYLHWTLNPPYSSSEARYGYLEYGFPFRNCTGTAEPYPESMHLAAGQSASGCVLFQDVPDTVKASTVAGSIAFLSPSPLSAKWEGVWNVA
jgi:hypothetical protein